MVYVTKQGDTWDMIAYNAYGPGMEAQAGYIMAANFPLLDYFIFPAGIEVTVPDMATETESSLPPWADEEDE